VAARASGVASSPKDPSRKERVEVFGLTKMRILLAATIAGYNLEVIRSFLAKKSAERTAAPPKRTRKKRRTETWTNVNTASRPFFVPTTLNAWRRME
jgi:hypothetical protein